VTDLRKTMPSGPLSSMNRQLAKNIPPLPSPEAEFLRDGKSDGAKHALTFTDAEGEFLHSGKSCPDSLPYDSAALRAGVKEFFDQGRPGAHRCRPAGPNTHRALAR
jgi:hypothetical protein